MGYDVFAAGEEFAAFVGALEQAAAAADQRATDAAQHADNAAQHADNAGNAAEQAAASAATATTKAAQASTSATAAAASATAASGWATTASGHAQTASDDATQAAQDAAAAAASAATAATKAAQASTSAGAAAQSVVDAQASVAGLHAPSRLLLVDAAFAGSADGFTFNDAAVAITAAQAIIAADAGRVTLRLYHDEGGEPVALPTPHTVDSLRAQGIDVEMAGQSGDGKAARFAAHILGWWLGHHPLSEAVLAETGYSVNLDDLPFPISEDGDAAFPPSAHRHDWNDLDGVPAFVPLDALYADNVAPDPAGYSAGTIIHNSEGTGGLYGVIDAASGKRAVRLGEPGWSDVQGKPSTFAPSAHTHAWSDVTGKPSTYAPSAHTHYQRAWFSDFLAQNRNAKTITTSGYECTATTATASGATAGHQVHMGTNAYRIEASVRVGTTSGETANIYFGTASPSTDGRRVLIRRSGSVWEMVLLYYVAGAATQTVVSLPVAPSDNLTWTLTVEADGAGNVTATATPLGGSAVTSTVSAPSTTIGPFAVLAASGGGLVLFIAGYIKIS